MYKQKKERILCDILNAYHDLKKPDFHFVMETYNSLKYKKVINDIYSLFKFKVKDNTDLNYDVCISLEFDYLNKSMFLYLSLVSTYAFLLYDDKVIDSNDDVYQSFTNLMDILSSNNFVLLKKNELLYEFDIDTSPFSVKDKKASILGLLFSFGLSVN
jgi:hypothetical protein